jgi:hypothetical protein
MKQMMRVSPGIPILTKEFKVEGVYSASQLPYFLDQPHEVREGLSYGTRYHLTVIDGRLYYLHEDAKSAPTIPA